MKTPDRSRGFFLQNHALVGTEPACLLTGLSKYLHQPPPHKVGIKDYTKLKK